MISGSAIYLIEIVKNCTARQGAAAGVDDAAILKTLPQAVQFFKDLQNGKPQL
jgi:hypothetical protein